MNIDTTLLANILGYLAFVGIVISFQCKKREHILLYFSSALILFGIHFALLGAWAGAIMDFIGAGRTLLYIKLPVEKRSLGLMWTFIGLFAIFGAITFDGIGSTLPVIASVLYSFIHWLERTTYVRVLSLIPEAMWFGYGFVTGSIPQIITSVFVFSSILIAIYRLDILRKKGKGIKKS